MSWIPRSRFEPQIRAPEPDGQEHPLLAGSVGGEWPLTSIINLDDSSRATSSRESPATLDPQPKFVHLEFKHQS